jgi:hypothetical protein
MNPVLFKFYWIEESNSYPAPFFLEIRHCIHQIVPRKLSHPTAEDLGEARSPAVINLLRECRLQFLTRLDDLLESTYAAERRNHLCRKPLRRGKDQLDQVL